MIHSKMIERLRMQYPPGTRIQLHQMNDPHAPVPSGTMGTVNFVDDGGNVHMCWDNGRTLALIPGEDSFSVTAPELTPMKLYMPLHCDLFSRNEYGDLEEQPEYIDQREALDFTKEISAAIAGYREPEEAERGLMHWYADRDAVNGKVHRAVFSVEQRDGVLWGVVDCAVQDALSTKEMDVFKDYITGQASDGWGEGFEQQDIKASDGVLNVHLWSSESDWHLMTEAEFAQRHEQQHTPQMDGMQL